MREVIDELCRMTDRREAYYRLADLYLHGGAAARRSIDGGLPDDVFWHGPLPEDMLKPDEDDRTVPERMRAALVMSAIFYDPVDYRESLVGIAGRVHWAAAVGMDAGALCEEVASVARPEAAAAIRRFTDLSKPGYSLEGWGLRRVETPHGPWITPDPYSWGGGGSRGVSYGMDASRRRLIANGILAIGCLVVLLVLWCPHQVSAARRGMVARTEYWFGTLGGIRMVHSVGQRSPRFPNGPHDYGTDWRIEIAPFAISASLTAGLFFVLWLIRKQLLQRPMGFGHCIACGYDLRGTPGDECPECGARRT